MTDQPTADQDLPDMEEAVRRCRGAVELLFALCDHYREDSSLIEFVALGLQEAVKDLERLSGRAAS